jgi:hypothetical protein
VRDIDGERRDRVVDAIKATAQEVAERRKVRGTLKEQPGTQIGAVKHNRSCQATARIGRVPTSALAKLRVLGTTLITPSVHAVE